ncbi:MAG TPA: SpoVG family protein [Gemmataceae bacterium]|nr:SpoVG family protein [Gemmataceae bacterium]
MVITEVRIKLMEDHNENERLQAFCSVTFDNAFVVRDLKIIEGAKGYFVAMPSRKLSDRCQGCGCKNHLRARFCNYCGSKLDEDRAIRDSEGRAKLHADIAHPINSSAREVIQNAVLRAFQEENERAKLPGYTCTYDDFDSEEFDGGYSQIISELNPTGRNVEHRAHASHNGRGPSRHVASPDLKRAVAAREDNRNDGFGAGIL